MLRFANLAFHSVGQRFCANFLRLPNLQPAVNLNLFFVSGPLKLAVGGLSPTANSIETEAEPNTERLTSEASHCAKYQTTTSIAQATRACGILLPGLAMACSLRDSLQGYRVFLLPHLTLRTSFPLPSYGQAIWPPGGSTATHYLVTVLTATFKE